MAPHDKTPTAGRPADVIASAVRLGALAAGGLGLLGLALAVICGLSASNTISEILSRALVTAAVMAAVGGLAGAIGGRLIVEQLHQQASAAKQASEPTTAGAHADPGDGQTAEAESADGLARRQILKN